MAIELTSAMVKEYGIKAGADVVGIAASKDFDMAPEGLNPQMYCRNVFQLLSWVLRFHRKCLKTRQNIPHAAMKCLPG